MTPMGAMGFGSKSESLEQIDVLDSRVEVVVAVDTVHSENTELLLRLSRRLATLFLVLDLY